VEILDDAHRRWFSPKPYNLKTLVKAIEHLFPPAYRYDDGEAQRVREQAALTRKQSRELIERTRALRERIEGARKTRGLRPDKPPQD
jgi:hypothetical protein